MNNFEQFYTRYVKLVYRICFLLLKNKEDAEDATQSVFFKFLDKKPVFDSEEHEKAYLIVMARNTCYSMLRHWWQRNRTELEQIPETGHEDDYLKTELMAEISKLNEKYRLLLYLYYYEGYRSEEIAQMLDIPCSTVRGRLRTARELLKKRLEVNEDEWKNSY